MDKAYKIVDRELIDLERELSEFYASKKNDLIKEFDAYMEQTNKEISKIMDKALDVPAKSDEFNKLYDKYTEAVREQTLNAKKYQEMIDSTTTKFAKVNQEAADKINNAMPSMYATGYNVSDEKAAGMGIRFDIVNENAVKRLSERKEINLPKRKLDIPKDKRWNEKQMNSAVLQGILNGESIDKISKRILPIVDKNKNSAIRAARTMTTEAENCGRLDGFKELEKEGAVLKKQWEAVADDRVRESHKDIDGEEQDLDKPFSNGCMYPGDGNGPAEEVWMCRCSMGVDIIGFRKEDGSINYMDKPEENKEIPFDEQEWFDELRENREDEFLAYGDEWLDRISESEKAGVVTYTSNAYREMNAYLRDNAKYPTTQYKTEIEECQKALKKASMQRDVITTRDGGKRSIAGLLQDENAISRIRDGDTEWVKGLLVKDKGFMSTTPFASSGSSVQYIIKVPKGANAAYVDKISRYQGERELLFAKDSEFYVHEAKYINGTVYVFMTLL